MAGPSIRLPKSLKFLFMGMWKDVTVFQWQQLTDLYTSKGDDLITPTISILSGMTEAQVDSLPLSERNALAKKYDFVHTEPEAKPEKFIEVNGRRYKCVYDVRNIPAARYIEGKHFAQDPNGNLHKIAASMVLPMKRTFWGWRVEKYNAAQHEQYANDMLAAPITSVLGSVVFFCEVYKRSIKNLGGYLENQMKTIPGSKGIAQALGEVMDGITAFQLSQNTKELN